MVCAANWSVKKRSWSNEPDLLLAPNDCPVMDLLVDGVALVAPSVTFVVTWFATALLHRQIGAAPLARPLIPSPCFFWASVTDAGCDPFWAVATGVICTRTQQQSSVRELFLSLDSLLLIDDAVEAFAAEFCNAEARMSEWLIKPAARWPFLLVYILSSKCHFIITLNAPFVLFSLSRVLSKASSRFASSSSSLPATPFDLFIWFLLYTFWLWLTTMCLCLCFVFSFINLCVYFLVFSALLWCISFNFLLFFLSLHVPMLSPWDPWSFFYKKYFLILFFFFFFLLQLAPLFNTFSCAFVIREAIFSFFLAVI